MNMRSPIAFCAVLASAVLLFCSGCDEHAVLGVRIVSGPTHVALGDTATFVARLCYSGFFSSPTSRIRMEWGDSMTTTSGPVTTADSVLFKHAWRRSGTYEVMAVALASPQPRSHPWTVHVSSAYDPVIDSARLCYLWRPTELIAYAHDPAGESLRLALAWSDGCTETTGFRSSPCRLSAAHRFASTGQVSVVFEVLNRAGWASAPDTLSGTSGSAGEVLSYWLGAFDGSPAVVAGVVYIIAPNDLVGLREGSLVYNYPGRFAGHLSFSGLVNHVYVGTEDGYLRAFTPELIPAWEYPRRESITGWQWGPAAAKGNALYVPCSNDSIYCLIDNGTSVIRGAAFGAVQVDAVVLDSAGSVYFGDGEGGLLKLTAGLNLVWRVPLQSAGTIYPPVVGADGTIYCTSSTNHVYAVTADGSTKWDVVLAGTCNRPVVGLDGLFAGTTVGVLHKLDLSSGATLWQSPLGSGSLNAAPILVTGGHAYVQTDDDRLYCVNLSTGDSVWVCNASAYLPSYRPMPLGSGLSSPTVDASGKVCLVGSEVLYRINAYSPLDASAPWPKWQHDLHNSGYVGGGK